MKKRFRLWLCLLAILATITLGDYLYHNGKIYPGVVVGTVELGGKTSEEAAAALRESFTDSRIWETEIKLFADNYHRRMSFHELGVAADIEATVAKAMKLGRERPHLFSYGRRLALLRKPAELQPVITVNKLQFYKALSPIAEAIGVAPENAELVLSDDRLRVSVRPERQGQQLDAPATLTSLQDALQLFPDTAEAELVKKPVDAEISAAYLSSLNIIEPVSSFSTTFSAANANRNENIRLAASALDETLILPDGRFSFNEVVGNTTAEKGYRVAPIIVGGELDEGLGGGICQLSSTLYNAVLLADLGIVERRNHGLAVGYLPPGRDATISYGWIDFKFHNDRNHAIWLRTFVDGNTVTTTLYGSSIPGHEVKVLTTDLTTITAEEKITKTAELPAGNRKLVKKGQPGYRVTVWRITSMNGEEIRREMVSQDSYRAVAAEYKVGTAELPASATDFPDSADGDQLQEMQEMREATENETDG